jgi:hypothetical protein
MIRLSARLGLVSALVATLSGFSGLGASASDGFTMTYYAGAGDGVAVCDPQSSGVGINGGCDKNAGPGTFDIKIADASGQKINAVMTFRDAGNANVGDPIPFCNELHSYKMPDNATQIWLRITAVGRSGGVPTDPTGLLPTGPVKANLPCGTPSAPTTGTVTWTGSAGTASAALAQPAAPASHATKVVASPTTNAVKVSRSHFTLL